MPLTGPSSLEAALSRIVGAPASSAPAGASAAGTQGSFNLAPQTSLPGYQSKDLPLDLISYAPSAFEGSSIGGAPTKIDLGAEQPVTPEPLPAAAAPVAAVPVAAPVAAVPVAEVAPAWKSPQTLARESSPAASGEWGGANEYIASKLGGYDWRGKASQVGMTADEYYGGPMSGENAYIASKIGSYDWRGKVPQISQYSAEYRALQKQPK